MAQDVVNETNQQIINEIKKLLWGPIIKEDVFKRWSQGFFFSQHEPTALVQDEGGPCAVIAPVQAFILKQLINDNNVESWKKFETPRCDALIVKAMVDIIEQVVDKTNRIYSILVFQNPNLINGEIPVASSSNKEKKTELMNVEEKENIINSDVFHHNLRILSFTNIEEVEQMLLDKINNYKNVYGVLLLLYSVICTKGLSQMQSEILDTTESLIDSEYGYGSQSLINLMLSGRAVSHVWDHDQNIGGLTLRGIDKQNSIGFLALLECLRYCEVGAFLKSPENPIWVLGSETHLTVLFSLEKRLVNIETPAEQAKRVFKRYDPEGNNFISSNSLGEVLAELGLVTDEEYVTIMRKKLDCESLGIILLNAFMDEFFPEEPRIYPDTFNLYHYNGLPRSNPENQVKYHKGDAVLLETTVRSILDSNPMLTVLQTKWPSIEVTWNHNVTPSLN